MASVPRCVQLYAHTAPHGGAVEKWVSRHTGATVKYMPESKTLSIFDGSTAEVADALAELTHRMCFSRIEFKSMSRLCLFSVKAHMRRWRAAAPQIHLRCNPDIFKADEENTTITIIALPSDALRFQHLAGEFFALSTRFVATNW